MKKFSGLFDLENLSGEEIKQLEWELVRSPNTPANVLHLLAEENLKAPSLEWPLLMRIVKHRNVSPETLRLLSNCTIKNIRIGVIENYAKTPIDVLEELASDGDLHIASLQRRRSS